MATAILDILDPDVWPVLDKWAAMTVFGEIPSRYCAVRYAAYARHLATEGAKHCKLISRFTDSMRRLSLRP